ncbi:EAL domain-containing protein [Pelomonas sp. SE-A7]|uniref:EAL domain-containing protein n=1 Tax=Pelomonas sp. SE-A7 TaxID=3054953 RepID=UPI00259CFC4E|nr:EAL domain-containing protein [Pelomonas sp. SE-A7]MDM4766003.1 EAL domain-containing protein [Pelomonas sp. SE-A7]
MHKQWFFEAITADGSRLTYVVSVLPFRIGRESDNDLVVNSTSLSRRHAEIDVDVSGKLRLTDLDSTNGSFVNRERINGSRLLNENDIVHFGNAEFRLKSIVLSSAAAALAADDDGRTVVVQPGATLSEHFSPKEVPFRALLQGQGMSGAAQPIVHANGSGLFAYELLGRSQHPDLPASPMHLFSLAAQLNLEAELSAAFRVHGIRQLAPKLGEVALFVNTHPNETFESGFRASIEETLKQWPGLQLVVEIHETAVMETDRMRELGAWLKGIGARFAYDDFGAGQARLNEIGEVPADFVKFDMALIRGIHKASDRKLRVVRDLVKLVVDLGSVTLAEGVEEEAEAQVCRELGFQLIQGYLTGRPQPFDQV